MRARRGPYVPIRETPRKQPAEILDGSAVRRDLVLISARAVPWGNLRWAALRRMATPGRSGARGRSEGVWEEDGYPSPSPNPARSGLAADEKGQDKTTRVAVARRGEFKLVATGGPPARSVPFGYATGSAGLFRLCTCEKKSANAVARCSGATPAYSNAYSLKSGRTGPRERPSPSSA